MIILGSTPAFTLGKKNHPSTLLTMPNLGPFILVINYRPHLRRLWGHTGIVLQVAMRESVRQGRGEKAN